MTAAMLGRVVVATLLVAAITTSDIFGQNPRPTASGQSKDELVPIEKNGLWGYADREDKVIIKPQFIRADRFSEGLALVWTRGVPLTDSIVKSFVKMGYIDKTGRWVIHSRFEYYFFDDFSDGLVPFRKQSSKWGFMDRTGKIVIQPRFDWAGSFSENVAPVLLDSKCADVDKAGKVLDQSQTVLPHDKWKQDRHDWHDRHGTYLFKPHSPPCS